MFTRLGIGFLVLPALGLPVAGLAMMGDPYVLVRAGVTRNGGDLVLVIVGCMNERVLDLSVTRWSYGEVPSPTTVWAIVGDAALPPSVTIGVVPSGLIEATPLARPFRPADKLAIALDTDQLERASSLTFTVRDVPETGFLSHDGTFDSLESLRRSILHDTPCWDPYGIASKSGSSSYSALAWCSAG